MEELGVLLNGCEAARKGGILQSIIVEIQVCTESILVPLSDFPSRTTCLFPPLGLVFLVCKSSLTAIPILNSCLGGSLNCQFTQCEVLLFTGLGGKSVSIRARARHFEKAQLQALEPCKV
eukprot:TRINITY_DN7725_c1_g1_i3.p1 TRINITY_DN7725_c1_g1~~TRINITY_DN7725_c1_g1_i3.p1  ORF type:complete len:120 (-),score=4.52 TRINITY_DN7725_c1_g1_i3:243-602(-)